MKDKAPWLMGLGVLILYLATANRWLGIIDSPEFASLFALGGVAHAPGYPTVVLAYRAFAWLPVDPKWGASLVTALFGTATVAILYRAARAWGASTQASAYAAFLVGVSAEVWLLHTIPEAFAVSNLLAAAILWVSAPRSPLAPLPRAACLGLLAGLSLGAHQSLVLLAPVGLWATWRAAAESSKPVQTTLAAIAALACGLSTYTYCLVAKSPVGLGHIESTADLWALFLRTEYGATGLVIGGERDPLGHLLFYIKETAADFGFIGVFLIGFGLITVVRAARADRSRAALVASWVLAGPAFVLLFDAAPQGPTFELVRKFHALSAIVVTPILALGVDDLFTLEIDASRLRAALGVLALFVVFTSGVRVTRVHTSVLEDYLRNTLDNLPPRAIWFAEGDHRTFGTEYLQEVEGLRPDVLFVNPTMLGRTWLFERLERRSGLDLPDPQTLPDGTQRLDLRALIDVFRTQTDRPIYVTQDVVPDVFAEYPKVPELVGWRVLRAGESPPPPAELVRVTAAAFDKFEEHAGPPEYVGNPWGWSVFQTWTKLWEDLHGRCAEAADPCEQVAARMLERYPDL